MFRYLLTMLLLGCCATSAVAESLFAVAVTDTPVLNRPDFRTVFGGRDGRTLLADECGQLRAVEFVALPGTVFSVAGQIDSSSATVYRVTTADYPYPSANGYFVDARFVRLTQTRPPEREKTVPAKERILANLEKRAGVRYVWGGNVSGGVATLAAWYPPSGGADTALWQLAGLDCSGLLYEATNGHTPRNTGSLVTYGKTVKIAGKSAAQIAALLQPLDLIVWPGHLLIALEGGRIIESRLVCKKPLEGVRILPAVTALTEIMKKRRPVDVISKGSGEFAVRRWYE